MINLVIFVTFALLGGVLGSLTSEYLSTIVARYLADE